MRCNNYAFTVPKNSFYVVTTMLLQSCCSMK